MLDGDNIFLRCGRAGGREGERKGERQGGRESAAKSAGEERLCILLEGLCNACFQGGGDGSEAKREREAKRARDAGREPERKQRLMDRGAAWWNACAAARPHRTSEAVIEPREIAMAVCWAILDMRIEIAWKDLGIPT